MLRRKSHVPERSSLHHPFVSVDFGGMTFFPVFFCSFFLQIVVVAVLRSNKMQYNVRVYCCAARPGFIPATAAAAAAAAGSHGCILFMRNNRSVIHDANVFGLMLFDCASNAAFCS